MSIETPPPHPHLDEDLQQKDIDRRLDELAQQERELFLSIVDNVHLSMNSALLAYNVFRKTVETNDGTYFWRKMDSTGDELSYELEFTPKTNAPNRNRKVKYVLSLKNEIRTVHAIDLSETEQRPIELRDRTRLNGNVPSFLEIWTTILKDLSKK